MPRPLFRFVAIALFYYFRECLRQLPFIFKTTEESRGLIQNKKLFFLTFKERKHFFNTGESRKSQKDIIHVV